MDILTQNPMQTIPGVNNNTQFPNTLDVTKSDFSLGAAKSAVDTASFERIRYMLLFNRYTNELNRSASGLASSLNLIPSILKNLA
ncbi:hypothetical protein [uncultured Tateyamaria sp.]|uniref:hypothetical protein n=1 Tax=uncultured Tateyamaria sp. TaxID=455651 RepID=UPI00260FBA15|nr:hypothetical protein [uncultured Tateyamaria sp.]